MVGAGTERIIAAVIDTGNLHLSDLKENYMMMHHILMS
jgi:hypothetical protein